MTSRYRALFVFVTLLALAPHFCGLEITHFDMMKKEATWNRSIYRWTGPGNWNGVLAGGWSDKDAQSVQTMMWSRPLIFLFFMHLKTLGQVKIQDNDNEERKECRKRVVETVKACGKKTRSTNVRTEGYNTRAIWKRAKPSIAAFKKKLKTATKKVIKTTSIIYNFCNDMPLKELTSNSYPIHTECSHSRVSARMGFFLSLMLHKKLDSDCSVVVKDKQWWDKSLGMYYWNYFWMCYGCSSLRFLNCISCIHFFRSSSSVDRRRVARGTAGFFLSAGTPLFRPIGWVPILLLKAQLVSERFMAISWAHSAHLHLQYFYGV